MKLCRSPGQRGFVIVAVLWIVLALASLALIFAAYISASGRAAALSDSSVKTEALLSASLELTAYHLASVTEQTRPSRGSFQFSLDEADVNVAFTSEAARIDLNFVSQDVLRALLVRLGTGQDEAMARAREAADRIIGWRTPPVQDGVNEEAALYQGAGYVPRQAPFADVNELGLVIGLPAALAERLKPFVTIFNGTADVDLTIAAPEVVAALSAVKAKDQQPHDAPAVVPGDLRARSQCYRVKTAIRFWNGQETVSEIVIAVGNKVEPYQVLSWQDDAQPQRVVYSGRRQ